MERFTPKWRWHVCDDGRSPDHNVLVQAKNKQRSNAKDSKVEQASRAEFMASFQGDVGAHAFVDQFSSFLFPFFSLLTHKSSTLRL